MKEILLFLCAIVTCHVAEGYWRNRGHHDHDRLYRNDGQHGVHPPWWRNNHPGPNNEGDNSNENAPSPPFRQRPGHHHVHSDYDNSDEEQPRYPPRPPFLNRHPDSDCDSSEEASRERPHPPRFPFPSRPKFLDQKQKPSGSSLQSSEEEEPDSRPLTTSSTTNPPPSEDPGRAINSATPVNVDIIAACARGCPVTSEYNPVCGSNGVTYANPGRLECAQRCGVDVQLSRKTACGVEEPDVTRTNVEACVSDCPVATDFNPVCGTNNVTYANPARLQCNQRCGVSVVVDKYAPCFKFPNLNDGVVNIEVDRCFNACPVNSIDKPVCGNNGVTYKNPDALQCARKCGINVNIKSRGKCPKRPDENNGNKVTEKPVVTVIPPKPDVTVTPPKPDVTVTPPKPDVTVTPPKPDVTVTPKPNYEVTEPNRVKPTTPSLSDVMACMQLCPLTSEYLPICGTDGITYTNPGRLLCSQFCGIDVNVKKWSPCESTSNINFNCPQYPNNGGNQNPQPTNIEACLKSCPITGEYKPVCGTNDLTYKNIDGLLCAKRCGVDVCVKKQSACEGNVNPLTPPTDPYTNITPPTPSIDGQKDKVTNGGIDFTIPPDVLHSIFPDDNPYITPTTEDYKVDERFNTDPPEAGQQS